MTIYQQQQRSPAQSTPASHAPSPFPLLCCLVPRVTLLDRPSYNAYHHGSICDVGFWTKIGWLAAGQLVGGEVETPTEGVGVELQGKKILEVLMHSHGTGGFVSENAHWDVQRSPGREINRTMK